MCLLSDNGEIFLWPIYKWNRWLHIARKKLYFWIHFSFLSLFRWRSGCARSHQNFSIIITHKVPQYKDRVLATNSNIKRKWQEIHLLEWLTVKDWSCNSPSQQMLMQEGKLNVCLKSSFAAHTEETEVLYVKQVQDIQTYKTKPSMGLRTLKNFSTWRVLCLELSWILWDIRKWFSAVL